MLLEKFADLELADDLPSSINDLTDLPQQYQETVSRDRFFASPVSFYSQFLMLVSLIGIQIFTESSKWWSDGTFKISPKFYYQHYLIHGKYKNCWLLPACFTFLSGKSFYLYNIMLTQLKIQASEHNLVLKPQTIACDFEKGALKAFKINF